MSRPPLVGYNHSFPYKGRVYHVQTEDSGVEKPHIFTHLFFQGLIISSAKTIYEPSEDAGVIQRVMKQQHKMLMKQLVRGHFDSKIVELLGGLEPSETPSEQQKRIRSYHHQMGHKNRVYSIQTYFYATVVTDLFFENVLIFSHLQDCRETTRPGSEEVKRIAQEQHKYTMRQLRDGAYDGRIAQLLGSIDPQVIVPIERTQPLKDPPLDVYQHRIAYRDLKIDVRTIVNPPASPHIVTELLHDGQLIGSAEFFDYEEVADEPDAKDFARECGKEQHTSVLKQLTKGQYDELILSVVGDALLNLRSSDEMAISKELVEG